MVTVDMALDDFSGSIEYGLFAKAQGVDKQSVEVPAAKPHGYIEGQLGLMPLVPAVKFFADAVLQFFNEF